MVLRLSAPETLVRVEGRIGFAPALSDKLGLTDPQFWSGEQRVRPLQPRFAPCGLRQAPQALTRSAVAAGSLAWIDGSIRFARKRRPEICEGEVTSMRVVLQRTSWRACMSSRHQSRRRISAGLRQRGGSGYNRPSASPTPGPMISQSPRPNSWRWRRGLAKCSTRCWVRASEGRRT